MTTISSELRPFNRLLLTGAAGGLGKVLRERLRPYANVLRLSDIAGLQPGYVFALPAHLEGANVTIRANGRVAGQGELVAVGDTLGVRLLSWS